MAFGAGPVTYRRFFVAGDLSDNVDDGFVQAVNAKAFGKYGPVSPDGKLAGWLSPDHLFDTDIAAERITFGRFAYLQMRLDSIATPAAILRSYIRQEEAAEREAAGKDHLNKRQRQQARERASARAEEEAKAGLHRRISAVPVLMDLPSRTIYFGSLGSTASDKFILLFRDTFGAALEPATSEHLAYRIMEAAGDPRSIEDAQPFHLLPSRDVEDSGFDFDNRAFFGREFLTWLWYMSEAGRSMFQVDNDRLAATIASVMRLDCDFRISGSDVIRCDNPAGAPEARAAIAIGKQPVKAGLILGCRTGEYSLMLEGPGFNVSGLRLPDPESTDPGGRLEERFTQVTEAAGLLDTLFGLFLGRRASDGWSKELASMKAWAQGSRRAAPKAQGRGDRLLAPDDGEEPPLEVIIPLHGQAT